MPIPRSTVRLRLTLIYGACFLAAGAILLTFNYLLVRRSMDGDRGPTLGAVKVFAPAYVAERQAGSAVLSPALGVGGQAGAAFPDQFTVVAPGPGVGLAEKVIRTITLPPEAGYGPVAGTIIERPVTAEGEPLLEKLDEYRANVREHTLDELVSDSAMALGGMSILSVLLGWLVAGRVLRPLHQITAAARRASDENLHERIALDGPDDELKELADTFDGMLGRLESAFESQKRFVANASHELRTPLAVMRAEVDVTLADPAATTADLRAMAGTVRSATERCEALIDGLLVLARSDRGVAGTEALDLADLVGEAAAQCAAEAGAAGVRLDLDLASAPVVGDPALLSRLAGNLVENGLRHNLAGGGWVRATTAVEGGRSVLRVSSSGPVVPDDAVASLFEPFRRLAPDRTTAAGRRGAGLGLSIVRSVASAHDGTATATPRPEGGLDVAVSFPAATA